MSENVKRPVLEWFSDCVLHKLAYIILVGWFWWGSWVVGWLGSWVAGWLPSLAEGSVAGSWAWGLGSGPRGSGGPGSRPRYRQPHQRMSESHGTEGLTQEVESH